MNYLNTRFFCSPWIIVMLLCGCGQKGDLYIPQPQPEVPVAVEPEKEDQ